MSTLVTTAVRHNASTSNNMVLDSNGRVGIGTATPANQLHVVGNNAARFDSVFALDIRPGTSDYSSIAWKSTNGVTTHANIGPDVAGSGSLFVNGATNIFLATSSTERMRIDASGRVTKPFQPMASGGPARGGDWFTGVVAPVSAHVNVGGHMNTSTGIFTAPVAGRYYAYIGLLHNNTWYIYVNINGVDTHLVSHGNAYATTGGAVIVNLQANDTIRFNTSGNYYGSSHGSYAIYLIS